MTSLSFWYHVLFHGYNNLFRLTVQELELKFSEFSYFMCPRNCIACPKSDKTNYLIKTCGSIITIMEYLFFSNRSNCVKLILQYNIILSKRHYWNQGVFIGFVGVCVKAPQTNDIKRRHKKGSFLFHSSYQR